MLLYGATAVKPRNLFVSSSETSNKLVLTNVIITAYCICKLCCGPHATGLTASGSKPVQGITIAGPRNVQLGTRVVINGHTYVVQDRTARRFDGQWDIYLRSHKDAVKFGIKKGTVWISSRSTKKQNSK